jgi:dTDP-L-rhamnose 4-epimerase
MPLRLPESGISVKILVTGGAGFIGSFIVDELIELGHEVVVVDDLDPAAHDGVPASLNGSATYHWADVRNRSTFDIPGLLDGVDSICHQAAKVGLGVDFADVEDYVTRNDGGTAVLLRALHDRGFDGRIVLASSMVVYGEGRYRCADHGVVRPGHRDEVDLDHGDFEPPCPECHGPREPLARPAQRVRGHQIGSGTPVQRLRPRAPGLDVHSVALPQRVRASNAPRHALRRCRQHLS